LDIEGVMEYTVHGQARALVPRRLRHVLTGGRRVRRIGYPELRAMGLRRGLDEENVVGFRNHFTGVLQAACPPCLDLIGVSGSLHVDTPLPWGCLCRGRLPLGHVPEVVFVPVTSRGISYQDLRVNGGRDWVLLDWHVMVFIHLKAYSRQLARMLPFVAMMQHFYALGGLVCPPHVQACLAASGFGRSKDEVLEFIFGGLCGFSTCVPLRRLVISEDQESATISSAATRCVESLLEHCIVDAPCFVPIRYV